MDRRHFFRIAGTAFAAPLMAPMARGALVQKFAEDLQNGEYNWFPERSLSGPMLIIVSIPDQKVHVYRNGIRVAASSCSTGKPGHQTPVGVFKILEKDKHHHSSTYNNASMPNMNRLTWSGIALHAGNLPGYPASHGCIRLPMGFSELLYGITRMGMTVVIADNASQPASVVHPSLVLGSYPREAFHAVASKMASVMPREEAAQAQTSLVISGKDRKATLYANARVIARDSIVISEPARPLANRVYHLNGMDQGKGNMKWQAVSDGKGDRETAASELHRIGANDAFAKKVHQHLHRGMVIVTTPDRHTAKNTTGTDFVIADGLY